MIRSITAAGAVLLLLGGCVGPEPPQSSNYPQWAGLMVAANPDYGTAEIIHLRGCDYVTWAGSQKGGLVHAGDCPNPIHQCPPCP